MTLSVDTAAPKSARNHAWQHLGADLPDVTSAAQALKHGRLAQWNIRKEPIFTRVGGLELMVPDRFAIIRDNPFADNTFDVLGDVGKAYQVIQNEQMERLLDTLAEDSGAQYVAAGSLDGGRRVFVTMLLPGVAKVGGTDPVHTYLSVMAAHDGDSSTGLLVTPVHQTSQSTLNLAFKGLSNKYTVRHTTGADKVLHQQAHDALEFAYDYVDAFQEQAAQLAGAALTQAQFERAVSRKFGAPKGAANPTVTRAQNKLDTMAGLFANHYSAGQTAWAGLTALAEWHDHYSPVRGVDGANPEQAVRSRKALLDPAFKNDALKLMLGVAA